MKPRRIIALENGAGGPPAQLFEPASAHRRRSSSASYLPIPASLRGLRWSSATKVVPTPWHGALGEALPRRVARCSGPTPEDVVDRERRQHRVLFDDNLEAMPIEELGESLEAPGAVVRFNDDLLHLRIALAGVVPM